MKKSLKIILVIFLVLLTFILISTFWVADLRTPEIKNNTQTEAQITHAKTLLKNAIKKQGMDKISDYTTYTMEATDHWAGMLGKIGNPYRWNGDKMALRFSVGDFDGQIEVLEGNQKGFKAGIQSWDYYESTDNAFNTNVTDNAGLTFITAALHYFIEIGNRLDTAPFIRYAGTAELKGKQIEKVFVSWGNAATKDYDQYVVWVGKESGLIEALTFTTRDNYKPTPAFMYGSLHFDDYRNIDGILIPFKQTAQIGEPSNDITNYVHQLLISDFKWNSFPLEDLRPFKNIPSIGNDKPKK
ncbi:hypothetical protein [Lacinutrix himadriensis]|uniref:hypothetical protein n=1 Tax=Lacinutrix himadriensis TaxID=641549 RepID=UPI0006E1E9D1|nr:hypothetical protein [Lacinutrix himadriensis]